MGTQTEWVLYLHVILLLFYDFSSATQKEDSLMKAVIERLIQLQTDVRCIADRLISVEVVVQDIQRAARNAPLNLSDSTVTSLSLGIRFPFRTPEDFTNLQEHLLSAENYSALVRWRLRQHYYFVGDEIDPTTPGAQCTGLYSQHVLRRFPSLIGFTSQLVRCQWQVESSGKQNRAGNLRYVYKHTKI